MDFSTYDKYLIKTTIGMSVLFIILILICILAILFAIHQYKKQILDKMNIVITVVGLVVVIVGILIMSLVYIPDYVYDIKNQAYIIYSGEYSVVYEGIRSTFVYIEDNTIRLEPTGVLDDGKYVGTVIYSKRSKKALEIRQGDG